MSAALLMLRKVPAWAWVVAALVAALFALVVVQTVRLSRAQVALANEVAAHAKTRGAWDAQVALLERTAREEADLQREKERLKNRANQKVIDDLRQDAARQRMAAAGARSELDRLRAHLSAADPAGGDQASRYPAACGRAHDRATALGGILEQCASRYAGLAEEAGRLSGQVRGLQDYVRDVVHGKPSAP